MLRSPCSQLNLVQDLKSISGKYPSSTIFFFLWKLSFETREGNMNYLISTTGQYGGDEIYFGVNVKSS